MRQRVHQGVGVPVVRDGESGDSNEGLLQCCVGDKREQAGVLVLFHTTGAQWECGGEEFGDSGGEAAATAFCLQDG